MISPRRITHRCLSLPPQTGAREHVLESVHEREFAKSLFYLEVSFGVWRDMGYRGQPVNIRVFDYGHVNATLSLSLSLSSRLPSVAAAEGHVPAPSHGLHNATTQPAPVCAAAAPV